MKCRYCPDYLWCRSTARNGGGCDMDGSDDFGCEIGMDSENFYYGEADHDDEVELPF